MALIGSIASGSLFLPIAGLVILAWLKQQWRNGKILRRWAREEAAARFRGERPGMTYSRLQNPTVEMLEKRIALIEGAEAA
ncbi:MAG: hypothetical protein HC888_19305, partial [Candidatus Competibacteraceae bacterium]|nr:hypothetical protein [Candidatus Competibacteraceae bacterium]